jgi:hypothetical protein
MQLFKETIKYDGVGLKLEKLFSLSKSGYEPKD